MLKKLIETINSEVNIITYGVKNKSDLMAKNIEFMSDRRILQLLINSVFFVAFSTIGIVNAIRKPEVNQESIKE